MRRLVSSVAAALIVLTSLGVNAFAHDRHALAVSAAQDRKTITVYVTRTGEKYHRDAC